MIYDILNRGSLRLENEDSLDRFISKGIKTKGEILGLLEFVRLESCSTDVLNDFFDVLSEHFYEINASIWAMIRARLVLPNGIWNQFPPLVTKGKLRLSNGYKTGKMYDIPDGIIAHLARECSRNVHDRHVVDVTSSSSEKETHGTNPQSGVSQNYLELVAKNVAGLETDS
jgi:hypothetical protein